MGEQQRVEGDVADLCLTFSVDEEEFGRRITVDLKDGGRCVAVTAENRIEYVHLIADYRLNQQIAKQTKALLTGWWSILVGFIRNLGRTRWLRFSILETFEKKAPH